MDPAVFKICGEALGIGFLIGVERYKDRGDDERRSAGVRTFSIIGLLGAVCGLVGSVPATLVTFAGLTVLLTVGYYRHSAESSGLTTEIAALLTFWLGYLVRTHEAPVISAAIVVAILLASKRALHDFIRERLTELELYDTLKFLVVVFVVLPLLPNRDMGPYGFFNPSNFWMLVILVSAINYSGYVLTQALGARRGLTLSSVLGGVVSTAAVTASLAEHARRAPETSRHVGVVAVTANAVQFPRLLVLVWAVSAPMGRFLTLPLIGMFAVGLVGNRLLSRYVGDSEDEPWPDPGLKNPFSLLPALKFGCLFVVVLLVAKAATVELGRGGLYLASSLAGLGDASAISLSSAKLVTQASVSAQTGGIAVLIAIAANALLKSGLAAWAGNRTFALWLSAGLATMVAVGVGLMALQAKLWF